MIRRIFVATARLVEDLYHLLRLCPECRRPGNSWLQVIRKHALPERPNVKLAAGQQPRPRWREETIRGAD